MYFIFYLLIAGKSKTGESNFVFSLFPIEPHSIEQVNKYQITCKSHKPGFLLYNICNNGGTDN